MSDDFLWCEKYRPRTIDDACLPVALKNTLQKVIDSGEVPNMIFSGTAGLGKTTAAKAICNELGLDYIVINGSEEGGIDTLRGKIRQFASSVSLGGGYKVVILDEADYLNPQSTQPALRGFIEEFSKNCRFILTCNFKNRIIEPLHSRCSVFEFNTTKKELAQVASSFMKRLKFILDQESIPHTDEAIVSLIMRYAPDWRRVINQVQMRAVDGSINMVDSDGGGTSQAFSELYLTIKSKDFKKMRSWVVNHLDMDTSAIFRGLYDSMNDKVTPMGIPQMVLILADYQMKAAFVADHELNVVACLTEIMANVELK